MQPGDPAGQFAERAQDNVDLFAVDFDCVSEQFGTGPFVIWNPATGTIARELVLGNAKLLEARQQLPRARQDGAR